MKTIIGLFLGILAAGLLFKRMKKVWHYFSKKRVPNFYLDQRSGEKIGIPVFTYHSIGLRSVPDSVTGEEFESNLAYLKRNGYRSLGVEEFYAAITGGQPVSEKAVVITFDDGRASLWTEAFPLLQKYNMKAVCFLIPAIMPETGMRETSADTTDNPVDLSDTPTITWEEARLMQASGLVEFQSHTLQHSTIFVSPEIVDFVHPHFTYGYHRFGIPVLSNEDSDRYYSEAPLGTPLYRSQPRLGAARRFFEDAGLRQACVDYVKQQGSEEFFLRQDWRGALMACAAGYRQEHPLSEKFETEAEQSQAIAHSLKESKRLIEAHLPGQKVAFLAYPWNHFSGLAMAKAIDAGYRGAFIDINPRKFPLRENNPYLQDALIPINESGDDPFLITRLDGRERLAQSLPGEGRLTFRQRLLEKIFELPAWSKRR